VLQRSMDEIFALAKELQETMDTLREKGRMNDPNEDFWTYDVWTAPNSEPA
jgi:hypothetical protein